MSGGNAITTDRSGAIYTAGSYTGPSDFDPGPGTLTLTYSGAFLTKFTPAALRGATWIDANGNGIHDLGESPLAGVVVELVANDSSAAQPVAVAVTGPEGAYRFDNPPPNGSGYHLYFRPPAGFTFTAANQIDDTGDSDVDPLTALTGSFAGGPAVQVFDAGLRGTVPSAGFVQTSAAGALAQVRAMATDAAGNEYVAGSFLNGVDLDPGPGQFSLTSEGGSDAFVACYTPGGPLLWATRVGGGVGDGDTVTGLVCASGNVYLTGNFRATAHFGSGSNATTLVSTDGTFDVFVCKLNASHQLLWAKRLGGKSVDSAGGIALDGAGNVYVAGDFSGTVDFDPGNGVLNLTSSGPRDAFVWKLNASGSLVWAKQAGGSDEDTASGVAVDANNNLYVTGTFRSPADFDPGPGVYNLDGAGGRDVFVWKLTAAGGVVWARAAGSTGDDTGSAVALDPSGNVYVTGSFRGTADFDPGIGVFALSSSGDSDAFVWKVTPAGTRAWAVAMGGPATDAGNAVTADGSGVYVAGDMEDTVDFDPGPGQLRLTSAGGSDAFVARLDAAGNRQWAHSLAGPTDDHGSGLAVDAGGGVSFAGTYVGPATFDVGAATTSGPAGVFLARLNQAGSGSIPSDAYEPNDSPLAATDLGLIDGEQVIDNLSLHAANEEDWFRFDLLTPGEAGNRVRIDFSNAQGNLDLELYSGATRVGVSATAADFEELSLAGLAPGTYFVRVLRQVNPSYTLTIDVPHALPRDGHEPNDQFQTATDLGALADPTTLDNLSIHTSVDEDWFRFTTLAAGTTDSSVRIDFHNELGDLDLELYDANDALLRDSSGAGDFESISLDGLPRGSYFVRVVGYQGALNPAYSLTVTPPALLAPDLFEPNDTFAAATLLPNPADPLRGDQSWDGLSITDSDEDWFAFTTVGTAAAGHAVRIDFPNAQGDLDLFLYDSADNLIGASARSSDGEQISLQGLPAGTYHVQVQGADGATQTSYRLSISAPTGPTTQPDRLEGTGNNSAATASQVHDEGVRTLSGVQTLSDLNLHSSTDQDWFRFTTIGKGGPGHKLVLSYEAANGALALELYNAPGKARIRSATGSNGTLVLSLNGLAAGTYVAKVFGPKGASNAYNLTFDTPTASKRDAWTVLVYMTADSLAGNAFNDINEMEQAAAELPGSVNFAVLLDQAATLKTSSKGVTTQDVKGSTGYALITPDTNPDQVATQFTMYKADQDTGDGATLRNFVVWATTAAPADHYALVLWGHGAGLYGSNSDNGPGGKDFLEAKDLADALKPTLQLQLPRMDVIAFDACFMGLAEEAYALKDLTDVVVGSQNVVPGDGFEYDSAFSSLADNPAGVTAETLATGLVQSYGERYGSTGTATLSAVRTSGLSALATALQTLSDQARPDQAAVLSTVAAATQSYDPLVQEQRDLGAFLEGIIDNGSLLNLVPAADSALTALEAAVLSQTVDEFGSSGLSVYLPVEPAGDQVAIDPGKVSDYGTNFSGFDQATHWLALLNRLDDAAVGKPDTGDRFESPNANDSYSAATNLQRLVGAGNVIDRLSLNTRDDTDWFRFQLAPDPASPLVVDVALGSAGGSLTAELRDASGQTALASQTLTTALGHALLTLNAPLAGEYVLEFSSTSAVAGYQLTINAPNGGPDWAGSNSTPAKAHLLDTLSRNDFPGLWLGAHEQDWFTFPTTQLAGAQLRQVVVSLANPDGVQVQLRDASGAVVSSAQGTGALVLPYTAYGDGESYTLVVINSGPQAVPYSLHFEAAVGTEDSLTPATAGGRTLRLGDTFADVGVQTHFELPPTGATTLSVLARAVVVSGKLTAYEARLTRSVVRGKASLSVQLFRTVNGTQTSLGTAGVSPVVEGTLRLEVLGQHLRLLLDGRSLLEVTDSVELAAGQVGVVDTPGLPLSDFQAAAVVPGLPLSYGDGAGLGAAWVPVAGAFTVQGQDFAAGPAVARAVYSAAPVADVAVQATYDLAKANDSVSLLARYTGTGTQRSHYEARLVRNSLGVAVATLLRVQAGRPTTLGSATAAPSGLVRLEVEGSVLRLLVNGNPVIADKHDTALHLPGQVGVSTSAKGTLTDVSVVELRPGGDDFNRADNTSLGSDWEEVQGDLAIGAGQLVGQANTTNIGLWKHELLDVSVSARVDLAGGQSAGLVARYTATLNYYEGRLTLNADGSLTAAIYRVSTGVAVLRKTVKWSMPAVGVLRFEVEGSTLRLTYYDKTLTVTDTELSGPGRAGASLKANDDLDDFAVAAP